MLSGVCSQKSSLQTIIFYLANANDIRHFGGFIFHEITIYDKQNKYYL
jgi:hypothetical protein